MAKKKVKSTKLSTKKKKVGRPRYIPSKKTLNVVYVCAKRGLSEKRIRKIIKISNETWYKSPNLSLFSERVKKGREDATEERMHEAEDALFNSAFGHHVPDIHITSYRGEVKITKIRKYYAPVPSSLFFYLCNKFPDQWKNLYQQEIQSIPDLMKQLKELANNVILADSGKVNKKEKS